MMLFKFVDDMALLAHLTGNNAMSQYQQAFNSLVQTFGDTSLELTITKTKELCCWGREHHNFLPTAQYLGSTKRACSVLYLPFLFTTHWLCIQKSITGPPPAEETQDFSCQQWHWFTTYLQPFSDQEATLISEDHSHILHHSFQLLSVSHWPRSTSTRNLPFPLQ